MNNIRAIQQLNQRELEAGVSTSASWHNDYRDTAWLYVGGFPFTLSEGDILTIFSQFGEPTHINLVRDKETGKSKGFCFLRYEDQRSTDLAVDNLGGVELMGRILKVDHTRYKRRDDEDEDFGRVGWEGEGEEGKGNDSEEDRPVLKEEIELERILTEYDDEDPMKKMLVQEKQEEVDLAIKKWKKEKRQKDKGNRTKSRHHHQHHRTVDNRPHDDDGRSKKGDRHEKRSTRDDKSERSRQGESRDHRSDKSRESERSPHRERRANRDQNKKGTAERSRSRSRSPKQRRDTSGDRDRRRRSSPDLRHRGHRDRDPGPDNDIKSHRREH